MRRDGRMLGITFPAGEEDCLQCFVWLPDRSPFAWLRPGCVGEGWMGEFVLYKVARCDAIMDLFSGGTQVKPVGSAAERHALFGRL